MKSGSHPGHDGVFTAGPMAGKTVNIKTYGRHESVLDISPHPCDCYLVLTGPAGQARVLPWVIDSVFLFERDRLLATLTARKVKIGMATSVRKADWEAARVFPPLQASPLVLSETSLPSWHSSHQQHLRSAERLPWGRRANAGSETHGLECLVAREHGRVHRVLAGAPDR